MTAFLRSRFPTISFLSVALTLCVCLLPCIADADDKIEFLSGIAISGTVTKIDKAAKIVEFDNEVAGKTTKHRYPYSKIHAINYRGKRYVINNIVTTQNGELAKLSSSAVLAKIKSQGSQLPDWYADTPLEYPKTLDLTWPLKPPEKGWNSQKNVGQYLWDVVYPNTGRWKSGIRLIYHLQETHAKSSSLTRRDRRTLGSMYFRLFQDYPRAAYWLQLGKVGKTEREAAMLAECYWRMGCRPLAMKWLPANWASVQKVKLLGDMGETSAAVQMADTLYRSGQQEAMLAAGDALRLAKNYDESIKCYQRILTGPGHKNKDYEKRYKGRAQDSIDAIRLFEQFDLAAIKSGTYSGSSVGYNGPIRIEVTVKDSKIKSVKVLSHREKQFYSAISDTTGQIVRKQDVRGIDGTTSATITSQAIVNATAKAFGDAR
jgi:uncharacterized protein with FMN-binding domain